MSEKKITRKDFLKSMGLAFGAVITSKVAGASEFSGKKPELDDEKQQFIDHYIKWLKEFNHFLEIRQQNESDPVNHKRLMELSEQAETFRPKLEKYMENDNFAAYFNYITKDISEKI